MDQIVKAPPPLPPAPPPLPPLPMSFTGTRSGFRGLALKGGLLEIVTLGFYRFWLVTDLRRHLWSNTVVDGDSAEYTGRGLELFIGFLIAMAILIPIYVLYFVLTLEAERAQAFASVPFVLFLYLFGNFAIYRARRYRLTRTVWRGVRFWMSGSGWAYAFRAFGWAVMMVVTLGLILPWRDVSLERYKMRNSYYGDLQGNFVGNGGTFLKRAWWLWLLCWVLVGLWIAAAAFGPGRENGGISVIAIIAAPFIYGAFRAIQWRWWLEGVRFGGVSLSSNLGASRIFGLYWKVIGWSFLLGLALLALLAAAAAAVTGGVPTSEIAWQAAARRLNGSGLFVVAAIAGYILYIVAINVVVRLYLMRDLWQRVADSVTISGLEAAAAVAAKGELSNAIGEGLADGLDVGGF